MTLCKSCQLGKFGDEGETCRGCILGYYFDDAVIFNKVMVFYTSKMLLTPQMVREKFHSLEAHFGIDFVKRFIPELLREIDQIGDIFSCIQEKRNHAYCVESSRMEELVNVQMEYKHWEEEYSKLVESLGKVGLEDMSMSQMFEQIPPEEVLFGSAPSIAGDISLFEKVCEGEFIASLGDYPEIPAQLPIQSPEIPAQHPIQSPEIPAQHPIQSPEIPAQLPIQWGGHGPRLPRTRRRAIDFVLGQNVQHYTDAYVDLGDESSSASEKTSDDPDYNPGDY